MKKTGTALHFLTMGTAALALSACGGLGDLDFDLRGGAGQFDTSDAARNAVRNAPQPDARGVISDTGYQVAVARPGDTVGTIAARVGLDGGTLASYNALPPNLALQGGEVIALPVRVADATGATNGGGTLDVATIAGSAIDRAEAAPGLPAGNQPTRHRVAPGETAFSIARQYDVPVAALAEWNGLGSDLALRDGQFLLIPIKAPASTAVAATPLEAPGVGSATPLPPSATDPLPTENAAPASRPAAEAPATDQTAASDTSRLRMPVSGRIIRPFEKGTNDGISIAAAVGAQVGAADEGTVAAITRDTDQVPILVLRHEGNLLTVYAGVDNIAVEKGDKVIRGQLIATVREGNPSFLHFEVREGFESVDPLPFLQ